MTENSLRTRLFGASRLLVVALSCCLIAACGGSTDESAAGGGSDAAPAAASRRVVQDPGVVTEGDWPVITGNLGGQRYSTLEQITADNFESLGVAWSFDASEFPSVNARSPCFWGNYANRIRRLPRYAIGNWD